MLLLPASEYFAVDLNIRIVVNSAASVFIFLRVKASDRFLLLSFLSSPQAELTLKCVFELMVK